MNCWEFHGCGREAGGESAEADGVCPAYTHRAGEACWLVAGTFCRGEVACVHTPRFVNCMRCDFYKRFDLEHRRRMRARFAFLLEASPR